MVGMEATGELVTGALIAGAIERTSGERDANGTAHELCLNCGTGLIGDYCHRCGQPEHIHRTLSSIWHDLAHGVFHFEGKIWKTLPLLVWRPGELTRRFIHGERARFISPMALFLFSVFLMFALFSAIGAHMEVPENKPPTESAQAAARAGIPQAQAELAQLKALKKASHSGGGDALNERIDKAREDLNDLKDVASWKPGRDTNLHTGWTQLDEGLKRANQNPNLTLYKIQSSAYKYSWALIPLSVPFLWLLYAWRPQYKLYDHAVFVTYSLSFMSLMVIVLTLLGKLGVAAGPIAIAAMLIAPLHMYRQLRGAYGTMRVPAIARTLALILFAGVTLLAFMVMLLTLGMLG